LDAQRAAVDALLRQTAGELRAEFTEVQSGKDNDRPQLREALRLCRLTNSILLIAKLDRLSRNVAFLATLQDSGAKFRACDMPEANELYVQMMAVIAQAERKAISERTKAALAVAKERGVRLGNPRLKPGTAVSAATARDARVARSAARSEELREEIEKAHKRGFCSLRAVARYLNEKEITSPQGGKWHANSVRRVRHRLASLTPQAGLIEGRNS
jgi:DNA invertase Pin-like site-specific DNA recombinase